jgi:hypothetical protein
MKEAWLEEIAVIRRTHTSFGVSTAPASCSGTSPKSRSNSDAVVPVRLQNPDPTGHSNATKKKVSCF